MVTSNHIKFNNPVIEWRTILGVGAAGMTLLGSVALDHNAPKWARAVASTGAIACNVTGLIALSKLIELEPERIASQEVNTELTIQRQLSRLNAQSQGCVRQPTLPSQNRATQDESGWDDGSGLSVELYDWENLIDEAVGIVIAGQSGSAKTSTACWCLGMLTRHEPAVIKVCDPHYNDIWEEIGLPSIGEFDEIQAELKWLVEELDRRRIRKKNKEPLGENLIVVADEIGACIESFEDPKVITTALKRIGSEGRKFGITLIAIDQSPNSDDLGISAKKRDNYLMIGLCSVAIALAKQDYKQNDPIMQFLSLQAYPCVVKLGGILTPAIHPTHSSYTKFKKKGNPPLNLMPINRIEAHPKTETPQLQAERERLESLLGLDCSPVVSYDVAEPVAESCPHCGSENIKWLSKNVGRKQCNNCKKTWSIKQ